MDSLLSPARANAFRRGERGIATGEITIRGEVLRQALRCCRPDLFFRIHHPPTQCLSGRWFPSRGSELRDFLFEQFPEMESVNGERNR